MVDWRGMMAAPKGNQYAKGCKTSGRPSSFSQEIADTICERLSNGETLTRICQDENMPARITVYRWVGAHKEFGSAYARARELQMDSWADELVDISDEGSNDWMERKHGDDDTSSWVVNGEAVRRSALRVDTRKFLMAKIAPKRFGDKLEVDLNPSESFLDALAKARSRASSADPV